MLEKQFKQLGRLQEQYPVTLLLVIITLTLGMLAFSVNLETDASFDTMYSPDSRTIQFQNLVSNEFGSTDTLFVLVKIDETLDEKGGVKDIRDPKVIQAMDELSSSMLEEPTVNEVFSISQVMLQGMNELPQTLEESKLALEAINEQGFDTAQLVNKDYSAAAMVVSIDVSSKPGSLESIQEAINKKIESASLPVGTTFVLTGQPALMMRIMNLLIGDNLTTVLIALVFVFFILWGFFRSPSLAFLSVIPVAVTLVWLSGTMVLLGIRVNMMIAAVGAMMVGMGVDYGIHMTHTFYHNVKKGESHSTKKTVSSVGSALVASGLTTAAGFLAMTFGSTPSSIIQGTVLGIGIIYAFTFTILLLPCLLVIHRIFTVSKLDSLIFRLKPERPTKRRVIAYLGKLAQFQVKYPKLVIGAIVLITILIIPGLGQVYFDSDNKNWIPENDPVIESFDEIGNSFGGTETLNLLVMRSPETIAEGSTLDVREPEVMKSIAKLDASLEAEPYITSISSPTDRLAQLNDGRVPQDIDTISRLTEQDPQLQGFFNKDFSIVKLQLTTDRFGTPNTGDERENYFKVLDHIEQISYPPGIIVEPQGGQAEFVELDASLGADLGKTTLLGFLFVILISAFIYRSFVVGFLAFVPIIFAMVWAVGVMGYIRLPFTPLTSGMLAIVMGIGIDFSIHLIHKTKEYQKEGAHIDDAIPHSMTSTGEAIFMSTVTTIMGFMSLALASLLVTQRLGYTLAVAIFCCFAACMLIVPAVLKLEYIIKGGTPK